MKILIVLICLVFSISSFAESGIAAKNIIDSRPKTSRVQMSLTLILDGKTISTHVLMASMNQSTTSSIVEKSTSKEFMIEVVPTAKKDTAPNQASLKIKVGQKNKENVTWLTVQNISVESKKETEIKESLEGVSSEYKKLELKILPILHEG